MEVTTKQYKRCDVVAVAGHIDSATAPILSQNLAAIFNAGRYQIVIDMENLEYMSSAGFRALIAAQRTCKQFNRGEVVLVNMPQNINDAFELGGFNALFKRFDNLTAAVGNF
jgi:anti-sigma B factor antagonist